MKNGGLVLKRVARAAKKAHDNGSLGKEVYELLINAGIEDMRYDITLGWKDAVLISAEPAAPQVEEYAGAAPKSPSKSSNTVPKVEPTRDAAIDGEDPDESTTRNWSEGIAKGTEGDSFDTEAEAEAGADQTEGYGFVWCLDCGRVDRAKYGSKTLPEYFKGKDSGCEGECGMVLILCGNCRRVLGRGGPAKSDLEHNMASRFNGLRLRPRMFEGSEAVQAVSAAMGREVKIVTDQGGVAAENTAGTKPSARSVGPSR